jgi:hypothetical protein
MVSLKHPNCEQFNTPQNETFKNVLGYVSKGPALRATECGQIIHSDICGPFSTESFGKKKYFISFIDDCTCHAWVYLKHKKSKAPDCFKSFLHSLPTDIKVCTL